MSEETDNDAIKGEAKDMASKVKAMVQAKIAGGKVFKAMYYVLLFGAFLTFILSIKDIAMTAGEPVTSTEVIAYGATGFTFPTVYICATRSYITKIEAQTTRFDGFKLEFDTTQAMFAGAGDCGGNGHFYSASGDEVKPTLTCEDLEMGPSLGGNGPNNALLQEIETYYDAYCYLLQTDKVSTEQTPLAMVYSLDSVTPPDDADATTIVGVMNELSPVMKDGRVNSQVYKAPVVDQTTTISLSDTQFIDERDGSDVTHTLASLKSYTKLIRASTDVSTSSTVIIRQNGYTKDVITTRSKTFGEIWSEVGGAFAGAILIVTYFFKEVVVPTKNNESEKVQVFRYTMADVKAAAKQAVVSYIKEEAKVAAGEKINEIELGQQ